MPQCSPSPLPCADLGCPGLAAPLDCQANGILIACPSDTKASFTENLANPICKQHAQGFSSLRGLCSVLLSVCHALSGDAMVQKWRSHSRTDHMFLTQHENPIHYETLLKSLSLLAHSL